MANCFDFDSLIISINIIPTNSLILLLTTANNSLINISETLVINPIVNFLKNFENDGKLLTSSIDGAAAGAAAGAVVGADPPVVDGGDTALIITIIPNKTFGDSTVLYTSFGSLVIKLKSKSDLRLINKLMR